MQDSTLMILVVVLFFVLMTKSCKSTEYFSNSWSKFLPKDSVNCNNVGTNKDDCCHCIQGYSFLGETETKKRCKNIKCNADFTADYRQASTNSGSTNTGSTNSGSKNTGSTNTGSTKNSCTPRCLKENEVLKIPKDQRWQKLDFGSCGSNACKKGPGTNERNYSDYGEDVAPHCQKKYNPCLLPNRKTGTGEASSSKTNTAKTLTKSKLSNMSLKQLCNQLK